jgi:hypothetical protein
MNRMLRVKVTDDEWLRFQTAALWTRRTMSGMLGDLIREYLSDPKRSPLVPKVNAPAKRRRG